MDMERVRLQTSSLHPPFNRQFALPFVEVSGEPRSGQVIAAPHDLRAPQALISPPNYAAACMSVEKWSTSDNYGLENIAFEEWPTWDISNFA
ncbi:hypothetical protein RRG08_041980 [Elysia crispata]|nr:hypothetical protein RRG08_041980 [Elysia crispata]